MSPRPSPKLLSGSYAGPVYSGHGSVSKPSGSDGSSFAQLDCGVCERRVSAAVIAYWSHPSGHVIQWMQCTNCGWGSVRNGQGAESPDPPFGVSIEGLPPEVFAAYTQARDSMSVGAYIGAELICRRILMHVAVERGAKPGLRFAAYVSDLARRGYVTPPMQPWVDLIRKHGNEAAHELSEVTKERAESTLMFTAELLRLVYEMQTMTRRYALPAAEAPAEEPPSE